MVGRQGRLDGSQRSTSEARQLKDPTPLANRTQGRRWHEASGTTPGIIHPSMVSRDSDLHCRDVIVSEQQFIRQ